MDKIELTQDDIVDAMVERFKTYSVEWRTGTYDRQDPTAFEKIKSKVFMYYGWIGGGSCSAPESEVVEVEINDVTWGVEFRITNSTGVHEGYFSRNVAGITEGDWKRCSESFLEVLKRVFKEGEAIPIWWGHELEGEG